MIKEITEDTPMSIEKMDVGLEQMKIAKLRLESAKLTRQDEYYLNCIKETMKFFISLQDEIRKLKNKGK